MERIEDVGKRGGKGLKWWEIKNLRGFKKARHRKLRTQTLINTKKTQLQPNRPNT